MAMPGLRIPLRGWNTAMQATTDCMHTVCARVLRLTCVPRMSAFRFAPLFALLLAGQALAQGASDGLTETLHVVHLPRGSEMRVIVSQLTGTHPDIAVLLFPGYPGILRIEQVDGAISHKLKGNFLIRARRFLNTEAVFTVMVDCPTDQWNTCDDPYRASNEHAADVSEVIDAMKASFGARQVYLLGTSYGTVSTAYLARQLGNRIDGAIHTSSFTDPRSGGRAHGAGMHGFDWTRAQAPQLFVHHRDDPCDVTRYASLAAHIKDLPLMTVVGSQGAHGNACEAYTAHGFIGREQSVLTAIHDWITVRNLVPIVGTE
jgi:hypothetical protein